MMVGLERSQSIRDRVPQSPSPRAPRRQRPRRRSRAAAEQPAAAAEARARAADAEQTPASSRRSSRPSRRKGARRHDLSHYEFRTDEWAALYTKRIDATIAALKSAGVPVFWVGLPSIRGPKSTSDMQYLNDLYRARAEKAGIIYIDVWDGFVDESGRFTLQGPDFEGQTRRLRAGDGVHFTKAGARKLAHYLEREIRRVMTPRLGAGGAAVERAAGAGRRGAAERAGRAAARRSGGAADRVGDRRRRNCSAPRDTGDPSAAEVRDPRAGERRGDRAAGRARRRFRLAAPRHRAVRHRSGGRHHHRADPGHEAGAAKPRSPAPNAEVRPVAAANPRRAGPRPPAARQRRSGSSRAAARASSRFSADELTGRAARRHRGSAVAPIRNLSMAWAHWRPSRIAQTTSDWPRRMSPAANTFGSEVA